MGWGPGSLPHLECGDGGRGLGPVWGSSWVLGHRGGLCCHFCHRDLLGEVVLGSRGAAGLEGKEAGKWSALPSRQSSVLRASLPILRDDPWGVLSGKGLCPSLPIQAWWASLGLSWGADGQKTGKSCRCLGPDPL